MRMVSGSQLQVHQVFVLDVPAGDAGRQAVIPASEIRARIVHGVRPTVQGAAPRVAI